MDQSYISHYREHGYAVIPGLFARDELAEMAERMDRFYAQGLAYGASFRHGNALFRIAGDAALGRIVRLVQWPAYVDAVLARYRTDARLCEVLAPLIGRNIKQIINPLHWKLAGAKAEFGFHQDVRFRRPRSAISRRPMSRPASRSTRIFPRPAR